MANKKTSRRALLLSAVSLILCLVMLTGTTFAWFTDNVNSGINTIKSGNLDVELQYSTDMKTWSDVGTDNELISHNTNWEPGHTEVVYLKISNEGSLALKYNFSMNVTDTVVGVTEDGKEIYLSQYLKYDIVDVTAAYADRDAARDAVKSSAKTLTSYSTSGTMAADVADKTVALVVYMPETVGNEANHKTGTSAPQITLGLNLYATQLASEQDSYGSDYDADTTLPMMATGTAAVEENGTTIVNAYNVETGAKVANAEIPAAAISETATSVRLSVEKEADVCGDVEIVADEQEAVTYDVSFIGVKEDNTESIKVTINIGTGLTGVKLYHYGDEVSSGDYSYDPTTGILTFYSSTFSPYTVVFDAEPTENPDVEDPDETNLPVAEVNDADEYEGVQLEWKEYSGLTPSDTSLQLESAYVFKAIDTAETVKNSPYKDWYCDYYVSMDRDVAVGTVLLAGNYGNYGWVGFENPKAVAAGEETPLLASFTNSDTSGWTYEAIVEGVNTFICGVAHLDPSLDGATFTVKLRLTNPADTTEYYDVNTVYYTFENKYIETADELEAAVAEGGTVVLASDIDMNGKAINVTGNVVLDLNGHTLTSKDGGTGNNWAIKVDRGASLTMKDSVGTGKAVSSCYGVYVQPGATFTMNGGKIVVSGNGVYDMGVVIWNGKFVMNAGTVEGKYAVYASDYWKNQGQDVPNCEITVADGCTLTGTAVQVDIYEAPSAVVSVPDDVTVNSTEVIE